MDDFASVEVIIATNQVKALSDLVDLTYKSSREKRQSRCRLVKGLSADRPTGSIEEGNNQFPVADGELVFTHVFEDDDKQRILHMHKGLQFKVVLNYLVSNIILPADVDKMDDMTCSELNQFTSDGEYKVSI